MKLVCKVLIVLCCLSPLASSAQAYSNKLPPNEALQRLKEGNKRFVQGKPLHPNLNFDRIRQAGKESQGKHANTTVVACSDSRVPVELLFDAGIMDIFVIRVAGNVCGTNEAGSIEYGIAHVKTPLLVVLGHTQCGAVTAVTQAILGEEHSYEENIVKLVSAINPAVKRAIEAHPGIHGDNIIPFGIEENVLESIKNLFMMSPTARKLVKEGTIKVIGAVYDVSTGRVRWMPESSVKRVLKKVEASPRKVVSAAAQHRTSQVVKSGAQRHDKKQARQAPKAHPHMENISLLDKNKLFELIKARDRRIHEQETLLPLAKPGIISISSTTIFLITVTVFLTLIGLAFRSKIISKIGVRKELFLGFIITIMTTVLVGVGAYYMLYTAKKEADIALASINMDVMSKRLHKLQKEFEEVGVKDKERGEKIVEEHKKAALIYQQSIKELLQFEMDKVELHSVREIQSKLESYNQRFIKLVDRSWESEKLKEELEDLSDLIYEKLKAVGVRHEEFLAELKDSKKTAPQDVAIQTRLVEELIKAEMFYFKVTREEKEFLLDKHFDRIDALEKELGKLYESLKVVKNHIPLQNDSVFNKRAELKAVQEVKDLLAKYVKETSKILVKDMNVSADFVDIEETLQSIEADFAALGQRARLIVAETKTEYRTVFFVLMFIYVFGGAYLAIVQTGSIVVPINKACAMLEGMYKNDFSQRLALKRRDEIGRMGALLDSLAEKLKKTKPPL